MENIPYQRPREKMQERGVSALTIPELIQSVIGSGTKRSSAARIARHIAALLETSPQLSYEQMITIEGVGIAKAVQIIAALELGKRTKTHVKPSDSAKNLYAELKHTSRMKMKYYTVNGKHEHIKSYEKDVSRKQQAPTSVKSMFTDVLRDAAASIEVGVGSRAQDVSLLESDLLSLLKIIYDTARLLDVKVGAIWLVNKNEEILFNRKDMR